MYSQCLFFITYHALVNKDYRYENCLEVTLESWQRLAVNCSMFARQPQPHGTRVCQQLKEASFWRTVQPSTLTAGAVASRRRLHGAEAVRRRGTAALGRGNSNTASLNSICWGIRSQCNSCTEVATHDRTCAQKKITRAAEFVCYILYTVFQNTWLFRW